MKFFVRAEPLRLKDAEDIGWFVWRAKWFSDVQASVLISSVCVSRQTRKDAHLGNFVLAWFGDKTRPVLESSLTFFPSHKSVLMEVWDPHTHSAPKTISGACEQRFRAPNKTCPEYFGFSFFSKQKCGSSILSTYSSSKPERQLVERLHSDCCDFLWRIFHAYICCNCTSWLHFLQPRRHNYVVY